MKHRILSLLLSLTVLSACTQEIDLKPHMQVKVAASCVLSNTEVQRLKLTYSEEMKGGRFYDEVEQATATLYEEDRAVGTFTKAGYGTWELRYRPVVGKSYRLEVELPDRPTLRATTTMPEPVAVRRVAGEARRRTKLFTQERLQAPYWMFCLKSSLSDLADPLHPPHLEQDAQVRLFQELGTNHPRVDHFNEERELSNWDLQYPGVALYKYYARVSPEQGAPEGTPYRFVVQHPETEYCFVVFRSASEEYDRYLHSVVEKMIFYESEEDPAAWFDQTVIYSNIEHGLGIFGAYYQTSYYYRN